MAISTATRWAEALRQAHDIFGERLTAVILSGDRQPGLGVANKEASPSDADRAALKVALEIALELCQWEEPPTIQAWFVGKNSMLDDRAPALVVRTDPEAVREAARQFVAYG